MATEKRKPTSARTKALKYKMGDAAPEPQSAEAMGMDSLTNQLKAFLNPNEPMNKSVAAQTVKRDSKEKNAQSKVVFSQRDYTDQVDNVLYKGYRRLAETELREVSMIDPYISAIIVNRCSQAAVIGYPSESKFDKGTRIVDLDPPDKKDFETEEEFKRECFRREIEKRAILGWVLTCGSEDQDILNAVFSDTDQTFKTCTLREFLEAQIRNLLTFGRCATQIIRDDHQIPVLFRPAPVETIFNFVEQRDASVGNGKDTILQSQEDVSEYNKIIPGERPKAYAQRIDGRNVNFFSEDDMHIWSFQKQALFGLNGYPLGPIETAIYMIFVHQQTLNYLRNQFVKGMGNKGMITMEATQEGVEISEADMEDFRQQFHNFVSRNDNSATVPVIGGPIKVTYVPLSSTPRDMEFLQVEEHIIRALCSAFQISPQEMGYGHLGLPQGGMTQANKQTDIIQGEERGLRMLMDIVYDGLNKILYLNFPEAKDRYRVSYVGVGEDTRDAVIARQEQEMNTTATMESLYSDSEKQEQIPYGGKVPLAPLFHANIAKYMKYGRFMELFFGDKDAAKLPENDFIIDPGLNQSYQALRVQPVETQQESAALGLEQQQLQMTAEKQQMEQGAQVAQATAQDQAQAPAPQPGQEEAAPAQGEEVEKSEPSLREKWLSSQTLEKSMKSYFKSWISANED